MTEAIATRNERNIAEAIEKASAECNRAVQKVVRASKAADSIADMEKLIHLSMSAMEAQVKCDLWSRVQSLKDGPNQRFTDYASSLEGVVSHVTNAIVVSGAGDTYSGRFNDMRRCAFDAKREWIDDTKWVV